MHTLDMDVVLGLKNARGGDDVEDSDSAVEEVGQRGLRGRKSCGMSIMWGRHPSSYCSFGMVTNFISGSPI